MQPKNQNMGITKPEHAKLRTRTCQNFSLATNKRPNRNQNVKTWESEGWFQFLVMDAFIKPGHLVSNRTSKSVCRCRLVGTVFVEEE